MKKILLIGFKDLTLIFRDRTALILMLLAPFVLTLGLGLVTGRLTSSAGSGISHIPVIIVNQDQAQLGNTLVSVFQSTDLQDLVAPTLSTDYPAAQKAVDDNQAAAAILIPTGFTDSVIPQGAPDANAQPVKIVLYSNPTAPVSVGVVRSILDDYLARVQTSQVGGSVIIGQLLAGGLIQPQQAQAVGDAYGAQLTASSGTPGTITLDTTTGGGATENVNTLAMLAPGMALMFLMYTVSNGGRSLLVERNQGTLARLAVSPTPTGAILGGKVFGIFLTGIVQMLILIGASSLLYQLHWGDPVGLVVLILAAVFGATGWGLLLCAIAHSPSQVSTIGSALMLIFGVLGGSFFSLDRLPNWTQFIAHVSPNAWGMDGFTTLALGGKLADLGAPILGLLVMGAVLFITSTLIIQKRGLVNA